MGEIWEGLPFFVGITPRTIPRPLVDASRGGTEVVVLVGSLPHN